MTKFHKQVITHDTLTPLSWHGHVTEHMVRSFFEDRHLGQLLGSASFFEYNDTHFVEFKYKQPLPLDPRGVDWLDSTEDKVIFAGHGTYWETAPQIMATGCFTSSDHDNTYGDREFFQNQTGVYVSSDLDYWAIQHSWPCNVFGNRVYYGIGSKGGKFCDADVHRKRSCFLERACNLEFFTFSCDEEHTAVSLLIIKYYMIILQYIQCQQPMIRKYLNIMFVDKTFL